MIISVEWQRGSWCGHQGDYGNRLEVETASWGWWRGVVVRLRKGTMVTVVSGLGEIRKMESGLKES